MSPFKTEKTPSFTVNDEKEFYHCFSTAEHGNIFDFVMKTQNLKFGESVKYLANLAGMRPYSFSKEDEIREEKWNKYKLIYAKYVEFYHQDLFKNPLAKEAKDYLKNRNLTIEEVKKFKIGYSNNSWDKLVLHFKGKGFTKSQILKTHDLLIDFIPKILGGYSRERYTHDAHVVNYIGPDPEFQGKEIFFGSNSDGGENNRIVILDVTDKLNPSKISTIDYSGPPNTNQ